MNRNILKLIKRIVYAIFTKKILFCIIILLLVLLFAKDTFAYSNSYLEDVEFTDYDDLPSFLRTAFESTPEYQSGNYFCLLGNNYSSGRYNYTLYFVPKNDNTKLYIGNQIANNMGIIINSNNANPGTCVYYRVDPNNSTPYGRSTQSSVNFWAYKIEQTNCIFYSDTNVYINNTLTTIFFEPPVPPTPPYIMNSVQDLTGLLSSTLTIETGSYDLTDLEHYQILLYISMHPNGNIEHNNVIYTSTLNSSSDFYVSDLNGQYFDIPVSVFSDLLIDGYVVNYSISYKIIGEQNNRIETVRTIYSPDLSELSESERLNQELQNSINIVNNSILNSTNTIVDVISGVSDKIHQLMGQVEHNSEATHGILNFLTGDNFSGSNVNLPSDNNQDITSNGLDNIFTMFYNAFTSGTAPDIVIPIPFTNKSFTIPANYTRNSLNSSNFNFVTNLIELFWWFIISVFIIKDIANKMNKVKSGDFENLENSNIKEDML